MKLLSNLLQNLFFHAKTFLMEPKDQQAVIGIKTAARWETHMTHDFHNKTLQVSLKNKKQAFRYFHT